MPNNTVFQIRRKNSVKYLRLTSTKRTRSELEMSSRTIELESGRNDKSGQRDCSRAKSGAEKESRSLSMTCSMTTLDKQPAVVFCLPGMYLRSQSNCVK